ncbi:hypothetical protein FFF34_013815 [Inquilinus sp. KBS0705]|nr:hypothetical protein FFF34_013815 [Inquilinus sp. KBS0705]
MLKSYQSIYVSAYRWSFKNFGHGTLPQFKSMFNVSFLLVILLTNAMLFTKLAIKTQMLTLNAATCLAIITGTILLLFANHFILLNNRWLKKVNMRLATISHHNKTLFSVALMVNVILACGFCLM